MPLLAVAAMARQTNEISQNTSVYGWTFANGFSITTTKDNGTDLGSDTKTKKRRNVQYTTPESQMEYLDRGLVVIPARSGSGQFLSWRLLGTEDYTNTTFDIIRDGNVIDSDLSGATCYTDMTGTAASQYQIVTKYCGEVVSTSQAVTSWGDNYKKLTLNKPEGGTIDGEEYSYTPSDISVGDTDGDGQYELFVKWEPSNSQDNAKDGKTGNVYIDCYKLDGTSLWRVDLGPNIRAGEHYTQVMVYDFNGDGKAEMICKTAPGSVDSKNHVVSDAADDATIKNTDNSILYRNSAGHILSGPEFLTVFDGMTGEAVHTIWYNPNRAGGFNREGTNPSSSSFWGDNKGNRGERYLACVAYLDGPDKNPSVVMCRGYYSRAYAWAVDFDGEKLKHKWLHASVSNNTVEHYDANWTKTIKTYNSNTCGKGSNFTLYNNGNHNISVGDVDGDGCDEVIWGSAALNNDGQLLYSVGYGHGDAIHLADLDPDRPGLEVFDVHEGDINPYGGDLHDAKTGEVLFSFTASDDTGRGMAADIDPANKGAELWSVASNDVYSISGTSISTNRPPYCMRLYWTGDLYDELFDGNYSKTNFTSNPRIYKWIPGQDAAVYYRFLNNIGNSQSCHGSKATPNLIADIFGDWREEIILWDLSDGCSLNIFTTNEATKYRVPTLMHDHIYRMGVAWQNVAYNQPPHLGYYLPDYVESMTDVDTPEPVFEIVDMAQYDLTASFPSSSNDTYSLPVVNVAGQTVFGEETALTATFTDIDNNTTVLEKEMGSAVYAQNYENVADATSWVTEYAKNELVTGDETYGQYVKVSQGGGSGPRSAYTKFYNTGNNFYGDMKKYVVEFDLAFHSSELEYDHNQVVLFGEGAAMPKSNALFNSTNYLFNIYGGINWSATYSVEKANCGFILDDKAWCHYIVVVDKDNRKVDFNITSGSEIIKKGSYIIPNGVNLNVQGIFVGLGRSGGWASIDNISIHADTPDVFPYTFTKPGILTVTSAAGKHAPATNTFVAELPYLLPDGCNENDFDAYLPVAVNDEKSSLMPQDVENGNAHLWRSGLKDNSSWATMVLPFAMTKEKVKEVFGDGVVVANLITSAGTSHTIVLETSSGEIKANVPFLIQGVSNDSPFLIKDINSVVVPEPMEATNYFQFIGNYTNRGKVPFTKSDYFFMAATDTRPAGLYSVKADGTEMTFMGYRAYFHAIDGSAGSSIAMVFDDETDIKTVNVENDSFNIYTLSGQVVKENANSIAGLPKGVYIIRGKAVVVK